MTTTNAAGHAGEVLTRASIDHAIAQTRMVFDSEGSAGQALDYLEQALNCESAVAAGSVASAGPALNELLATAIAQAMHERKDPGAAAVAAAKAFRAGLAA